MTEFIFLEINYINKIRDDILKKLYTNNFVLNKNLLLVLVK